MSKYQKETAKPEQGATTKVSQELLQFLDQSPTPYHATSSLVALLEQQGFTRLIEDESWALVPGSRYYVTRSDSTIVAFIVGTEDIVEHGIRIVGAHTDSPCLKLKPQPEKVRQGYQQVGIEVYGGALLNPWFDRDLSLAGQVCYLNDKKQLCWALVDFKDPIAVIPSLAIHLDREANKNRTVNPQTDMNPILFQGQQDENFCLRTFLREKLVSDGLQEVGDVLEFDLSFYDTQPASIIGLRREFLASARLDNLLSSFIGTKALADADTRYTTIMVCNDHEEIGSQTDIGALGTALEDVLERLIVDPQQRQIALRRSLMLSVDNAHGVHPNYSSKHDDNHGPKLNEGPVIKFDANQSYATSAHSSAFIKQFAALEPDIPVQTYVTRADMRCGSTIGPLTSSKLGVKTLDLGVPTFAMHSIRELAGMQDVDYLYRLLQRFYGLASVTLT